MERDDVLEEIQREIKSFGDNVKDLKASRDKDLEAVRKSRRSSTAAGCGGNGGDPEAEFKQAREFTRVGMSARGELKVGTDFDENVDVAAFKSYARPCRSICAATRMAAGRRRQGDVGRLRSGRRLLRHADDRQHHHRRRVRDLADAPDRNVETISTDAIEYPRDDDEASAGWVGEQEAAPRPTRRRPACSASRCTSSMPCRR
jgi:hypothetical protein